MQSTYRDRSYITCLALCLAALILAGPVSAQDAVFTIYENGTGYSAVIEVLDTEEYRFTRPGLLGEAVPIKVRDIRLVDVSGELVSSADDESRITFPKGDYRVLYEGTIDGTTFSAVFSDPHNVTVYLPADYGIKNPLLGYVSQGGVAEIGDDGYVITWQQTRYLEVRYYDEMREIILYAFGTIWIVLMVIFLFGYYAMRVSTKE